MNIDSTIINQITASVFNEMLELTTEECGPAAVFPEVERVVAVIRISGHLEGTVVTEAPVETARHIAGAMYAEDSESLSDSEIHDAVGEIVNMIGGNIKGMSEGNSLLSLPRVALEAGTLSLPMPLREQLVILVAGLPLRVSWHQTHVECAVA